MSHTYDVTMFVKVSGAFVLHTYFNHLSAQDQSPHILQISNKPKFRGECRGMPIELEIWHPLSFSSVLFELGLENEPHEQENPATCVARHNKPMADQNTPPAEYCCQKYTRSPLPHGWPLVEPGYAQERWDALRLVVIALRLVVVGRPRAGVHLYVRVFSRRITPAGTRMQHWPGRQKARGRFSSCHQ